MHCEQPPFLNISSLYLFLWRHYYNSRVLGHLVDDDSDLILAIQLSYQDLINCVEFIGFWLSSLGPVYDFHLLVESKGICWCPEHRLCCLVVIHLLQSC